MSVSHSNRPLTHTLKPTELHPLGATVSLAYRGSLDPDHILYGLLSGSSDARQERLRSRHLFVPAAPNLLNNLAGLAICATNHKWNAKYCKNTSRLRVFIPRTSARPVGMSLSQTAWVKLQRLRTGVGRFHSSMHKWGLAPLPNCVLIARPIHRAPYGARDLTVLDDETRCWLTTSLPVSDPGSRAVWGSKRINPWPQFCLCLARSGCSSKRRQPD